ncbi:MAG: DUF134 domain-containing protein [Verrucomicrobia bacterium]|nr:DUF134 domain-containing protein [Verrucomicrobiota bacterium]
MSRPFKTRCIGPLPGVTVFKPAGVPATELEKVVIHLDELEAVRLVDGEGLDHAQAAQRMNVSRPTVSRILGRVHGKIAQALTEGQALFIQQGGAPVERVAAGETRGKGRMRKGKGERNESSGVRGRRK